MKIVVLREIMQVRVPVDIDRRVMSHHEGYVARTGESSESNHDRIVGRV